MSGDTPWAVWRSPGEGPEADEGIAAVFGVLAQAMYYGQALEGNLRHLVASAELRRDRELSIDDAYSRHATRTLGQLVHRLKDLCELTADQSRRLDAAVRSRNALAHHFVDEKAHRLLDAQGRRGLVGELEGELRLLKDVNSEVLQIVTDASGSQRMPAE